MKCLVTGAAGFIGSHLCERLLKLGHEVTGLDAFIPYYSPELKEKNLVDSNRHPNYRFMRRDLRQEKCEDLVEGVDVIFHLAAMPGLAKSWIDFDGYWTCNVQATQRLLEVVRRAAPRLERFIQISTSSVYGRFASGDESLPLKPISPYGVTKLAAEQLCRAFEESYGLPLVVLRYFSVYGPRQRPDMGYNIFIRSLLKDEPIIVYGDGQQVRGNTYIADCVDVTVRATEARVGETYNVGGGETASVWDILHKLEMIAGKKAIIRQEAARPGDQRYTFADTTRLRRHLDWEPRTSLDQGLAKQVEWQKSVLG
jgi:nucleoside-diphosphate-sugar epimerase